MKNIVTHNYAPLRLTFVQCCISEVVGVDVKQRAPQQNSKIQYVTRYGILRHYTATFTFRRQKYKHTTTNKYEVLQLRHVVQLKNLRYMFPPCAYRSRFLYSALLRDPPDSSASMHDRGIQDHVRCMHVSGVRVTCAGTETLFTSI